MKMAEKFSKQVENMVGRYEQFLLFLQCSKKTCIMKDLNYNIGAAGQNNIMHTPFTIYLRCFEVKINVFFVYTCTHVRILSITRSLNGTFFS